MRFEIFPFDGRWGFRSAAGVYYSIFPESFQRRVPPHREGIWIAGTDVSQIPNAIDFGIGIQHHLWR